MKRFPSFLVAVHFVWTCSVHSQTPTPAAPAPKKEEPFVPAPVIAPADLEYASSVALAVGVKKLKELATADPQGWIIPPIQRVRITGYKDVPRKFRRVEVERPIYEYTDLVVMIPNPSPGEPPLRQVRKVPTRQTGSYKETIIRWDPNGPEEMIDKQPIYEHVGDTSWQFNLIGDSAMALTALRKAGVPENDLVMYKMSENLLNFLDTYGPPDHTWSVAQLAIALARTPGEVAQEWTLKLASRLLDGQITDGPARGLWGPMCIHPRVLAVVIRDYLAGEAEVEKLKEKLKERPTKANQLLLDVAEGGRNRLKNYADSWSRSALRFATVEWPLVWDDQMSEKVQFAGATEFFYNQRAADMESTWVVLHALSECSAAGRLPKESLRPEIPPAYSATTKIGEKAKPQADVKSQLNATTVPPENAIAVLARAANALVGLLGDGSAWSEANIHQPVHDFDTFDKYLSVPVIEESFMPLPSPVTPLSAVQGVAALDSIGRVVGVEKMAKFLPKLEITARGRVALLEEHLKTLWRKENQKPSPAITARPELYDLLLAASRPLAMPVPVDANIDGVVDLFTRMLILGADPDGTWGTRFRRIYRPSSMRERWAAMSEMPGRVWRDWRTNLPVDINKAHVAYWNMAGNEYTVSPGTPFATAVAVNYLASRLKQPGGLVEKLIDDSNLADQRKALDTVLIPPPPPPKPKAPPPPTIAKTDAKPAEPKKAEIVVPKLQDKPKDAAPKKDETF